jgi:hypothetical protein
VTIASPTIDTSALPPPAQKILDPKSPAPLRQMAAKGIAPGLKPGDAITVVVLLSTSDDAAVAATAKATLEKLPAPLLNGALGGPLHAGVLDAIATRYASDLPMMEKFLTHASIAPSTVAEIAMRASEPVAELVATNEQRLLENPAIIEKLYMNKATRMSTADRILELAVRNKIELSGIPAYKEAAAAIVNELIMEPTPEPTPDDELFKETEEVAVAIDREAGDEDTVDVDEETGEEAVKEKFLPLHTQLDKMTISQKIRRAMLGTASERGLLVRDRNRLVSQAVVQSPLIQENEIVRLTASRAVSEDVLRIISQDKRWGGSHQVKLNLVQNPRCPLAFSSRLIAHLREHELRALSKSKNVSGAIAKACRQQLERKGIK